MGPAADRSRQAQDPDRDRVAAEDRGRDKDLLVKDPAEEVLDPKGSRRSRRERPR